jgi:hypothetical protein
MGSNSFCPDVGRHDLWHEFSAYARTRLVLRLPIFARAHGCVGRVATCGVQAKEMALTWKLASRERNVAPVFRRELLALWAHSGRIYGLPASSLGTYSTHWRNRAST